MSVSRDEFKDARSSLAFSQGLRDRFFQQSQQQQMQPQMPQPMQRPQAPMMAGAAAAMPQEPIMPPMNGQQQDPLSYERLPVENFNESPLAVRRSQELRPIMFGEISNRPPEKQELEARVILNTALNRIKEHSSKRGARKSIDEILTEENQYQAFKGEQYNLYKGQPGNLDAEKKKQIDAIIDKLLEEIESGAFSDNTEGAFYYKHNPDGSITYDNDRALFEGEKTPKAILASFLERKKAKKGRN